MGGMSVAVGHVWCDLLLFKREEGPAVTWRQVKKSTPQQQRPLLPFSLSKRTIPKLHHNFPVKFIQPTTSNQNQNNNRFLV